MEGQFVQGYLNGWGRCILKNGQYLTGWYKNSHAYGYLKAVSLLDEVNVEGLWYNHNLVEAENAPFNDDEMITRKVDV